MAYADQWNPNLQSILREDRSEPPGGEIHQWFKTTMTDQYKNSLFTCNCEQNVTGSEAQVRQHVLEFLIDEHFMGTVSVTASGFVSVANTPKPKTTEEVLIESLRNIMTEIRTKELE